MVKTHEEFLKKYEENRSFNETLAVTTDEELVTERILKDYCLQIQTIPSSEFKEQCSSNSTQEYSSCSRTSQLLIQRPTMGFKRKQNSESEKQEHYQPRRTFSQLELPIKKRFSRAFLGDKANTTTRLWNYKSTKNYKSI